MDFKPGQRWTSETEPELGLGTVLRTEGRFVFIVFPGSDEVRQYARQDPPLRRARFKPGDVVRRAGDGQAVTVAEVLEDDGLLRYRWAEGELSEAELGDMESATTPLDRMRDGQVDDPREFFLRREGLERRHANRRSPVRGLVGGRIQLVPHQLYIADEVTRRSAPRVLLADEVGLGKTIEACLILHRLHLAGRAERVLILLPESLVHQWFIELFRRFHLTFTIMDGERYGSTAEHDDTSNPFLEAQHVLCSIDFLLARPDAARAAVAAGWNLLVVDEAHHLHWSPDEAGADYTLVERLAGSTPAVLLLTATPEQLGEESHFARMRLLDPNRYRDFETFREEVAQYHDLAQVVNRLLALSTKPLPKKDQAQLAAWLTDEDVPAVLARVGQGDEEARRRLLEALVDRHGTGRVLFRNTRASVPGFPGRQALLVSLAAPPEGAHEVLKQVRRELHADARGLPDEGRVDYRHDPRITWLAALLRKTGDEKILLICRTRERVAAVAEALRHHIQVKTAVFHEALPLLQRDKNAAWFHDEHGARLLVCSEIGGEGRNFQFAHHLVLFDLPFDPELVEQRIGRLDRIGQTQTIQVHVPYLEGSGQEALVRWYREGLGAFETCLAGGYQLGERFGEALRQVVLSRSPVSSALDELLTATRTYREELANELEAGRDRLLELTAHRPEVSRALVAAVGEVDASPELEDFLLVLCDHFGLSAEELSNQTYLLAHGPTFQEGFPGVPAEGLMVTLDRATALAREEVQFLSWDHPMMTGALDALLGGPGGNAAVSVWDDVQQGLYLEALHVLEVVAPAELNLDRFLPATPIRTVVNHRMTPVEQGGEEDPATHNLFDGRYLPILNNPELTDRLLPGMVEASRSQAEELAEARLDEARREIERVAGGDWTRLKALRLLNDHVRPDEVAEAGRHYKELSERLAQARLRLDAIHLVWRGPAERLG